MPETESQKDYSALNPSCIINAIESVGYLCDGRILALNSYENRVYQIGIEDSTPLIAKFYRPERWSNKTIMDEHQFTLELLEEELPVLAPVSIDNTSLHLYEGYRFALFPRFGGYAPELDNKEHLQQLGRVIARMHNVGSRSIFQHRPKLEVNSIIQTASDYLLSNNFIPIELEKAYQNIIDYISQRAIASLEMTGNIKHIRLHGDCHHGNVLIRGEQLFLVDFDDARTGPAIQDIWMFLSGDREYMTARLQDLLDGYTEFRDFNPTELNLLETLRTLRIIYYTAWLAQRWHDPAFPLAFPFFNTQRYWEEHILSLKEQLAMMEEPPLQWQSY